MLTEACRAGMGSRVIARAGRSLVLPADLPNLCSSQSRDSSNCLGTNPGPCSPPPRQEGTVMKSSTLTLVDSASPCPCCATRGRTAQRCLGRAEYSGTSLPASSGNYLVHFAQIPAAFRSLVKDYMRFMLAAGRAAGTLNVMPKLWGSSSYFSVNGIQMSTHFTI